MMGIRGFLITLNEVFQVNAIIERDQDFSLESQ